MWWNKFWDELEEDDKLFLTPLITILISGIIILALLIMKYTYSLNK